MPISNRGTWLTLATLILLIPNLVFGQIRRPRDERHVMKSRQLPVQPTEVISLNMKTLSTGNLHELLMLHASNLDYSNWLEFHYRNQSAEGIENRLRELAKKHSRFRGLQVSDTITRFLVYDLRDRDIVQQIEEILRRGGQVEVIIDESNTTEFKLPKPKKMAKWTDVQMEQFLSQFDKDKDGKVTAKDAKKVNEERYIGIEIFKQLKGLQKKYSADLLALDVMPTRLVPIEGQNFIPINHAKHTSTRIERTGEFILGAEYNSNFTPNEKHGRLDPSLANQRAYVQGKNFSTLPTAEPYIQMGIELRGLELLNHITREIFETDERVLDRIDKGKGFQRRQREMPKTYRFAAKDGSFMDVRIHPSFGNRHDIGPWDAFTAFLADPNIKPQGLAMSQFVFSNRKLRQVIDSVLLDRNNFVEEIPKTETDGKRRSRQVQKELKDHRVAIVVNSQHGLAWYSQLWNTFSRLPHEISPDTHRLIPGLLTPLKRLSLAIRRFTLFNGSDLKMENIFRVFLGKEIPNTPKGAERPNLDGNITPVKLHSKAAAVWYRNQYNQETRYRIYITSANASANAGVGTYEHTIEIDTDNRHLFELVQKHVIAAAKHRRTVSFARVYLRTILYSIFENAAERFQKVDRNEARFPFEWDRGVVEEFERVYQTRNLKKIIAFLESLKKRESAKLSKIGVEMIRLLKRYHNSGQPFIDDALYLLWRKAVAREKGEVSEPIRDLIRKHLKIDDMEETKTKKVKRTRAPRGLGICLGSGRGA